MIVEKILIKSNNISFGLPPAFNDEVEQHVKIYRDGRYQITRYVFGSGVRKNGYVKAAKKISKIPPEKAANLLDLIGNYFIEHDEEEQWFITDVGEFRITITMEDGTKIRRKGSLDSTFVLDNDDLSSTIRAVLGADYLFLFDGGYSSRYSYLSVKFPGSDKEYYYRTEDNSIDVGDTVLVPAGPKDRKEIVKVVRKERFTEDELPMPLEEVKSVIGKVLLSGETEPEIPCFGSNGVNEDVSSRGFREDDRTTADGIKFALNCSGDEKLAAEVKDVPVIARAEQYMRDFLMDRAGSDLETYLNDFSDYLLKNHQAMQAENQKVADMVYPLSSVSDQFAALYGSEADADMILDLKRKFWKVYQLSFMRGLLRR